MTPSSSPAAKRSYVLLMLLMITLWIGVPFVAAGTLAWAGGWRYALPSLLALAAEALYVGHKNPQLAARRHRIGAGAKRWDLHWNWLFWVLMVGAPLVAGLERGQSWARPMAVWFWPLGVVLLTAGMTLVGRAMGTNPFFEGTVRIQHEVGHRVFAGGPYRWVRHPGYAGVILWALASPFLVGSWWALVPALASGVWVVLRTVLEDATLRRELDGYTAYARRVRFRLVPFVW